VPGLSLPRARSAATRRRIGPNTRAYGQTRDCLSRICQQGFRQRSADAIGRAPNSPSVGFPGDGFRAEKNSFEGAREIAIPARPPIFSFRSAKQARRPEV
jgi:hypothetical protein